MCAHSFVHSITLHSGTSVREGGREIAGRESSWNYIKYTVLGLHVTKLARGESVSIRA